MMTGGDDHVLFLRSGDASLPAAFEPAERAGRLRHVRQDGLQDGMLAAAAGLIVCANVDQIDLMQRRPALHALLDRGGRIAINGHVLRPYVDGLTIFRPIAGAKRRDLMLTRLADHPIFAGFAAGAFETNRGVAGFYGRGHHPLPDGAIAVTGIGPDRLPVDWVWPRSAGGAVWMHAGNDLWIVGDDQDMRHAMAGRLVDWCLKTLPGRI